MRAPACRMTPQGDYRMSRCGVVGTLAMFVVVCVVGVGSMTDPGGWAEAALAPTAMVLAALMGVGPLLRRARPTGLWLLVTLTGGCFLVALLLRPEELFAPYLGIADVLYVTGYLSFGVWLFAMARRINCLAPGRLLLDTAMFTVATTLLVWSLATGQDHPAEVYPSLQRSMYPVFDSMALAASTHVALRMGRLVPAMWWNTAGIAVQVLLDLYYAYFVFRGLVPPLDLFNALSLVPYFLLALAATHPSAALLGDLRLESGPRRPSSRRTAAASLLVLPAYASLLLTGEDATQWQIRFGLVAVLIIVLFIHLHLVLAELRRSEEDSRHRATHDPLTGLLNRSALLDSVAALLREQNAVGGHTVLLFLDCDHFKEVNDTWGHHAGDTLLCEVSARLSRAVRSGDLVARHGGDEFVVVMRVSGISEVPTVVGRVEGLFREPVEVLPGHPMSVGLSIGAALASPGDVEDPVRLFGRADAALYEAKNRGRGCAVLWDDVLASRTVARTTLHRALAEAVASESIELVFQPIMSGPGHTHVHGYEALARWEDPELGVVPPDVFIQTAEELGIIAELGESVLNRACAALVQIRRHGRGDEVMSVNVSPSQLLRSDFAQRVVRVLESYRLPGEALWLEMTENVLVHHERILPTVTALRNAGVRLSLDDLGTGYASFTSLMRMPVDGVKLDRSLLDHEELRSDSEELIGHTLGLLRGFGVHHVVAEGVETEEQAAMLERGGCPYVQGWFFGRPAPLESWLTPPDASTAVSAGVTTAAP